MKELVIKLTRDNFNFRFKQYEGMYFHANINEDSEVIKYKISLKNLVILILKTICFTFHK